MDPPAREASPLNGFGRANDADADDGEERTRAKVSFGDRLRAEKDAEEEAEGANGAQLTAQKGELRGTLNVTDGNADVNF